MAFQPCYCCVCESARTTVAASAKPAMAPTAAAAAAAAALVRRPRSDLSVAAEAETSSCFPSLASFLDTNLLSDNSV